MESSGVNTSHPPFFCFPPTGVSHDWVTFLDVVRRRENNEKLDASRLLHAIHVADNQANGTSTDGAFSLGGGGGRYFGVEFLSYPLVLHDFLVIIAFLP